MPENSNIADAVAAGVQSARPAELDTDGRFRSVLVPGGAQVEVIDLVALEQDLAAHPHRKKGAVHVQDAESFIGYVVKHYLPGTEVFADTARRGLVGVINAHDESSDAVEGLAGHGDHRVLLELIHSDEWKAWTSRDKQWMAQLEFAEHLEDNAAHVIDPDAATMLEIAQHFHATPNVTFKSAKRLSSGEVSLHFEEQNNAKAGEFGDIDIPTMFVLSLRPFVGADPVEVPARFRYRIRQGQLALSYALLNTEQIVHEAFVGIVDAVRDAIEPPVFLGRPA